MTTIKAIARRMRALDQVAQEQGRVAFALAMGNQAAERARLRASCAALGHFSIESRGLCMACGGVLTGCEGAQAARQEPASAPEA